MEAIKPVQQAFGSSGGKFHLAKKITAIIPDHSVYVEPYVGGAAVFFYKEPSQKEILNDKDKEVVFAYRFIRDMTPEQYARLQRQDWVISQSRFNKVKAMQPKDDEERFYKFYYLKKGSFRNSMTSVNKGYIGHIIGLERLSKVQERLRGVSINCADALNMIEKYDSPNTVFYLDPPYPGVAPIAGNAPKFTKDDLIRLTNRLKHIKGRFILSMNTRNTSQIPRQFEIQRVSTLGKDAGGQYIKRFEVLATNYHTERGKHKVNRRRWHPIHPQLATCRSRG